MKVISAILKNPLSIWIKWLIRKWILEYRHSSNNLSIGYQVQVSNCRFGCYNTLYSEVSISNVSLGDFSYVSPKATVSNASIGKFSCIGPETFIGLGRHPSREFVSSHPVFYSSLAQTNISFSRQAIFEEFAPIVIGNDVWVGARAIILDGITIGDGAIVGAGAVVTKDIPAYAVVGEIPARILRYRFDRQEIDYLQKIKWWDRDIDWLKHNANSFRNINQFIENNDDDRK